MAIQSFASPALEQFFREGRRVKRVGWANVARVAARKLDMLDDRWRVVFRWTDSGATEVDIRDYH